MCVISCGCHVNTHALKARLIKYKISVITKTLSAICFGALSPFLVRLNGFRNATIVSIIILTSTVLSSFILHIPGEFADENPVVIMLISIAKES